MSDRFYRNYSRTLAMGALACVVTGSCSMSSSDGHRTFEHRWAGIRGQQPAGLALKLTLQKATFYQGEVIEATLTFANTSSNEFSVATRTYDRSGRLTDISFVGIAVDGRPVPDPLDWYYTGRCYIGGGLSGGDVSLGEWNITLPANQWLRFDAPGKYRLYAWSNRTGIELVSDVVEVEITSLTAAEERRLLTEAEADLLKGGEMARNAVERLRYLQTPAARKTLLELVSREDNFEAQMGLLSVPDPVQEAAVVLAGAEEPEAAVSQNFFWLYSSLKSYSTQQSATGDVRAVVQAVQDSMNVAQAEFAAKVRAALPKKAGSALATSALTLLFRDPKDAELRAVLVSHRDELTDKQLQRIFEDWDSRGSTNFLGGADFIPILRMAVQPPHNNRRALAFLAKVAPDEARPIILEDIARDTPRFYDPARGTGDVSAYTGLPDRELPELDPVLRAKLRDDQLPFVMPLIARYATPQLLTDVLSRYNRNLGSWAYGIGCAILKYWIRCQPKEGADALRHTYESDVTPSSGYLLKCVLLDQWVAEAKPVVLMALENSDLEGVEAVAIVIEQHGLADLVPKLIDTIERVTASLPKDKPETWKWRLDWTMKTLLESKRLSLTDEQVTRLINCQKTERDRDYFRKKAAALGK